MKKIEEIARGGPGTFKNVRRAYKARKRREALVRQALCISHGKTREGRIPAPLERF